MSEAKATYRVIRVSATEIMVIGDFPSRGAAVDARDDDVIAVLAANGGWYQVITHWLFETGEHGCGSASTAVSAVGVDPNRDHPPDPLDLLETRHWLAGLHDRTG